MDQAGRKQDFFRKKMVLSLRKEKQMKKLFLLIGLLIILSGCAVGVYDGHGFHGVGIGVPYPYYSDGHYYSHGATHYPYPPGRYYRGPRYYR